MAADEQQVLLSGLDAYDWVTVQDAVEMTGDWLRTRPVDNPLKSRLAERLLHLSSHPKWEVRKAVAHALLFLRHDAFHAAIARIVDDENAWVREAARRTLQRRSELTRADIHGVNRGDAILGLLAGVEAKYGPRARRAALKVADHLHHRFVREAYHEIVRVISPLDASLLNLEREIGEVADLGITTVSHVQRARACVKLLTGILDDLRTFTTEAMGEYTAEDLLPILKEAEELALSHVDHLNAGLVVRQNVDASLKIEANRSRLLQALINIVVNAVEACSGLARRGELHIAARRHSSTHIVISIADNGCGMSDEALRDCVQLYSTGKPNGMGFGLPLAKKIIEIDHQGTLSIESLNGEGTTVSVILPIEQIRADA